MDEFERIAKLYAPLAAGFEGALGLKDDAAVISMAPGEDLVVTADALVAEVHFLPEDAPGLIARKALRCNLSDLAAKGATPFAYLQTTALPREWGDDWLGEYAAGLALDQREFGVHLIGGDSTETPGPATISITAFGRVAQLTAIRRAGAGVGDRVFVSGTLGDAALGLMAIYGRIAGLMAPDRAFLVDRYRLPQPRVSLGPRLVGIARSAVDVSDGAVADLGHVCEVSGVGAVLDFGRVPLSAAAAAALGRSADLLAPILTGGDDYEILFTAPPACAGAIAAIAQEIGIPITEIGYIIEGHGVQVRDGAGRIVELARTGYRHFRG